MNAEERIIEPTRKHRFDSVMDRFMSKVCKLPNGCWAWNGARNRWGYGKFTVGRVTVAAHRYAYAKLVGRIPDALTIDHLCRNRSCVNPEHMQPVTMRENLLRGDTFQARNASKTHCKNGHEFTPVNTRIVNGWRQCRECMLIRKAAKRREAGMTEKGRYETKITRRT